VNLRRCSSVLALVLGAVVLAGCTDSAPPAAELADEVIETLDVPDQVKTCMKAEVEGFALSEEEAKGFEDLDDVAKKAADGQEQAKQIIARFQAALADCNAGG
jgi:hypothetical protein